jgi:hypothetical protein
MQRGVWQTWRRTWAWWWGRLLPAIVLACLLATLAAPGVQAQPVAPEAAPVTLDEYVAALQSARQILAAGNDAALEQARAELAPLRLVLLPSGAEIAVAPLLGRAGESLPPAAALARVETALAQLQSAANDDTAARLATLAAVLAGPQFVAGEPWWEPLLRWLAEWWDRIFPQPQSSPGSTAAGSAAGDAIWTGIGVAGAIALVLLLAYWLRGLLGNFIGDASVDGDGAAGELPQTPAEARRRAAELASGGDFRDAVRHLYLSALLTLEQNGLVPADRSLTNREVLARVSTGHPVRSHLQPVVETFDDVWYGVHEPDDQTYAAYTHSIDELEALAQRPTQEAQP